MIHFLMRTFFLSEEKVKQLNMLQITLEVTKLNQAGKQSQSASNEHSHFMTELKPLCYMKQITISHESLNVFPI